MREQIVDVGANTGLFSLTARCIHSLVRAQSRVLERNNDSNNARITRQNVGDGSTSAFQEPDVSVSRGTEMNLSLPDRVEVPKHVLVRFLEKESVFLNLETEDYYGLDETGTRMWQVVTAAPSIEDAYAQLLNEFDVEAELLRQNLSELLVPLIDDGLLRVHCANVGMDPAI
jgi:Coenzyme PQQ synthesis protein D (PqqD)